MGEGQEVVQQRRQGGNARVIIGVALGAFAVVLGIAAVAWVGVVNGKAATTAKRVEAVQRQLGAGKNENIAKGVLLLSKEVEKLKAALNTSETRGESLTKRVKLAEKQLKHYDFCMPELREEANSEQFEPYTTDGYMTGGWIRHSSTVSRFCSDIFESKADGASE
jgi:uncharacterized protein HemX